MQNDEIKNYNDDGENKDINTTFENLASYTLKKIRT